MSPELRRCLATTNLVESPHSDVRLRTRRMAKWQGGGMVLRWAAGPFLAREGTPRLPDGCRELRTLATALDGAKPERKEARVA